MNRLIDLRSLLSARSMGALALLFGLNVAACSPNPPFINNDGGNAAGGTVSPVRSTSVLPNSEEVSVVAWSPDSRYIAAGFNRLAMGIWNTASHNLIRALHIDNPGSSLGAVAFSPDGRYLAAGQSVISLWNAKTGARVRNIVAPFIDPTRPQSIGVHSLAFSPDGKTLMIVYIDLGPPGIVGAIHDNILFYQTNTGNLRYSARVKDLITTPVYFTPGGKYLVDGGYDIVRERNLAGKLTGNLRYKTYVDIRDAATGKLVRRIDSIHTMAPTALALSADGKMVATGTDTGTKESHFNKITHTWQHIDNRDPIRIWDFASGRLLKALPDDSTIRSLAFSPNGKYLAACQWDRNGRSIWIWDVASGQVAAKVKMPKYADTPLSCVFNPDGSQLAAASSWGLFLVRFRH